MPETTAKTGVWHEILKPTLVLIIIATLISVLLAFTYNAAGVAALATAGLKPDELAEYQPTVLPGATTLKQISVSTEDPALLGVYADEGGSGAALHILTQGYQGNDMKLLVGINPDGTVAGVVYTECNETPGLGTKTNDPAFLGQFVGKSGELTVGKAGGGSDIDAISGATISSNAVTDGVNIALQLYDAVKGEIAGE